MSTDRELTYGEKAVGLNFNHSNDPVVQSIKIRYANAIDELDYLRSYSEDGEQKRLLSIAITETQAAQMWAVKAATWGS